jgi:aryl-alcohol dehydrogenase-like predicted oxidoreductase
VLTGASVHTDFLQTTLGRSGKQVHRLGLSATYRPGRNTVLKAIEEGMNFFFLFGFDTQMTSVLRTELKRHRERYVVATGAYNLLFGHPSLRRTLEKRLRQLDTEYIDVFLFLGVTRGKQFSERDREELYRFRQEGKVQCVGMSSHDRIFAGKLAAQGALDVIMIRYNAAHRGAEADIFPYLTAHNPGVVSYTATRWTALLRRPGGWPEASPVPSAGMCYRFVLSNPHVHVCLTAPRTMHELQENLAAVRQGPLSDEEMEFMHRFGSSVYAAARKPRWQQPVPFEAAR